MTLSFPTRRSSDLQDVAQRHGVARFTLDLLDSDLVSGGDAILFAARAHDCEHGLPSNQKLKRPRCQSPAEAGDFPACGKVSATSDERDRKSTRLNSST